MKKHWGMQIVSILLAMAMLVTTLSGCGKTETNAPVEDTEQTEKQTESVPEEPIVALTKGEWITGLASTFGLTDYMEVEPYFADINSEHELFDYVQSAAEWELFEETGGNFEPDADVTRAFAVATAVLVSDVWETDTEEEVVPTYAECIEYAVSDGLIKSNEVSYLESGIDAEEGQKILDWAEGKYQNKEFVEYDNVVLQDTVVDLTTAVDEVASTDEVTTISSALGMEFAEGDIIITPPTPEDPAGVARKVVSVDIDAQGNYILTTTTPELGEVFAEFDFAEQVVPTEEDLILYEGATLISVTDTEAVIGTDTSELAGMVVPLNMDGGLEPVKVKAKDFKFEISLKSDGGVEYSREWETALGEFKGKVSTLEEKEKQRLIDLYENSTALYNVETNEMEDDDHKFEKGYEVIGTFEISDIYAEVEVKAKKVLGVPVGIEKLELELNHSISTDLTLKGKLESERKIGKFSIVLGTTGITIDFDIILYNEANGQLAMKIKNSNNTVITYKDGKVKKTNTNESSQEAQVAMDIETGGGVSAKLKGFGITVTDAKVKAGVKYEFETSLEEVVTETKTDLMVTTRTEGRWNIKSQFTLPVVTVGLGQESKSLLKLNLEWQMAGPKGLVKVKPKTIVDEYAVLYVHEETAVRPDVVALKAFIEEITVCGRQWDTWTLQELQEACSMNESNEFYVSEELIRSDGSGIWATKAAFDGSRMVDGNWVNDVRVVLFNTRAGSGTCDVTLEFIKDGNDGSVLSVKSNIPLGDNRYTADPEELEWLEGHGTYVTANNCGSLADIFMLWGIPEKSPELFAAIGGEEPYEAALLSEYGLTKFKVDDDLLVITFEDETSPYAEARIVDYGDGSLYISITRR